MIHSEPKLWFIADLERNLSPATSDVHKLNTKGKQVFSIPSVLKGVFFDIGIFLLSDSSASPVSGWAESLSGCLSLSTD